MMKSSRRFRPGAKWQGSKSSAPPPPFRAPRRSELMQALEREDLLARHRLHLLARGVRRRGAPTASRRTALHQARRASRDRGHRRSPARRLLRGRPTRARVRRLRRRPAAGDRHAPRRAWCPPSARSSRPASSATCSRSSSRPRRSPSASTCRPVRSPSSASPSTPTRVASSSRVRSTPR